MQSNARIRTRTRLRRNPKLTSGGPKTFRDRNPDEPVSKRHLTDLAGSMLRDMAVDKVRKVRKRVTSTWASIQCRGGECRNVPPQMLLTADETARALSISPRTLWTLTKEGEIPFIQVGSRSVRYSVADLEAWIDRKRQGGGGSPAPQSQYDKRSGPLQDAAAAADD